MLILPLPGLARLRGLARLSCLAPLGCLGGLADLPLLRALAGLAMVAGLPARGLLLPLNVRQHVVLLGETPALEQALVASGHVALRPDAACHRHHAIAIRVSTLAGCPRRPRGVLRVRDDAECAGDARGRQQSSD